jgi:site-specific DNA-methyltransferase (adenine-specific)
MISKPYFEQGGITIYHADCLDVLRQLPSETIDTVITDPPYGIDFQSGMRVQKSKRHPKIANDKQPFIWFLLDAYRVLKNAGCAIVFCRWDVQDVFEMAMNAAGFGVKAQLVWDRVNHGMGDLTGSFAPQHDVMWFGTKGRFRISGKRPRSVIRVERIAAQRLVHPNEKPAALMEQLVEPTCAPEGSARNSLLRSSSHRIAVSMSSQRQPNGLRGCPSSTGRTEKRLPSSPIRGFGSPNRAKLIMATNGSGGGLSITVGSRPSTMAPTASSASPSMSRKRDHIR